MIAPPATIGILGGGQLGRYAIVAARLMGYRTIVLDPDPDAPAGRVADRHLVAPYDDAAALDAMAAECAVVTIEFENPPAGALERLAAEVAVAPAPTAVAVAQDRIAEKRFLEGIGVPVAKWVPVAADTDLLAARSLGTPAILKTARLGYDGKGQVSLERVELLSPAWEDLGRVPCVLERRVPLDAEVSVIVARRADGWTAVYPAAENHHVDGILNMTVVPARVAEEVVDQAWDVAEQIAKSLDYVGVLAVEMFVSNGRLLVNEIAPRPHNSGHWTLDASVTSQFAQQVRAVTGAALGDTSMTAPAVVMVNLLGDLWFAGGGSDPGEPDWSTVLADESARLHLYGKAEPRPGRKMGHITVLGADATELATRATELRATIGQ